MVSGV
jgi:hypothetical protein